LRADNKKMVHGMSCAIYLHTYIKEFLLLLFRFRIFTSTSTNDSYSFFCRLGTWGVCFTYATFFSIKGLVAAGRTYENSPSIRKACQFILSKQLCTGGWGESHLSNETQVIQTFLLITLILTFFITLITLMPIHIIRKRMVCLLNSY
jgi:hypothetical protein